MQFIRFIIHDPQHAFSNMAHDEAISEAVRQKISPSTLRIYRWDRPSVSIGYFQKVSEIDLEYCKEKDYPVVRRLTGGRAILHDNELTYSFSSSRDNSLFNGTLHRDYTLISNALVEGLKHMGVEAEISFRKKRSADSRSPACFQSVSFGEITVAGKKIIGSAQKRYKDGFLQQGSVILHSNTEALQRVLKLNGEEPLPEPGSLQECAPEGITFNRLAAAIKEAFEKELQVRLITDEPSKYESKIAKELEANKYSNPEWNALR